MSKPKEVRVVRSVVGLALKDGREFMRCSV